MKGEARSRREYCEQSDKSGEGKEGEGDVYTGKVSDYNDM